MELKEFYEKLRSFVDEDPTDKTDEDHRMRQYSGLSEPR